MTPRRVRPSPVRRRVRSAHVLALLESLTERDWQIVESVNRLRLVTDQQLERMHLAELSGRSRAVVRWRVLKRLVDHQVLAPLPRRVGSGLKGSAQLVYALDTAGQQLLRLRGLARYDDRPVRTPAAPGVRFMRHTVAVSDLLVSLTERERMGGFTIDEFQAEPACWWPDGRGGWLKPDAYLALSTAEVIDHWWTEVDLATEAVATLRGKLCSYLDFLHCGQLGPGKVVPRVLMTVPERGRLAVVQRLLVQLPPRDRQLFGVVLQRDVVEHVVTALDARPPGEPTSLPDGQNPARRVDREVRNLRRSLR